uniref:hypothetical protein n=1 Tax=Alistipes indistinctus TaxID=626932 RepID=UPI004027DE90
GDHGDLLVLSGRQRQMFFRERYTVVAVYITRKDAGRGSGKKLTLIFLTNRWNYTGKFVY